MFSTMHFAEASQFFNPFTEKQFAEIQFAEIQCSNENPTIDVIYTTTNSLSIISTYVLKKSPPFKGAPDKPKTPQPDAIAFVAITLLSISLIFRRAKLVTVKK